MKGAVLVALAAAVGNMLQGWDNSTIAGAVMYVKKEFHLETSPTVEGLIVAMSLIGATIITTFSGPVSDMFGRRPMMIMSSLFYFLSGLIMLWSPNVYVLLAARLLDGFGTGLAVTIVPVYISETAPSDIRGQLNTFPQFMGSGGMFLSYCILFLMTLTPSPSWRLMLGILSIHSLTYLILTIFFLPESPRWLVSKSRMAEAKLVLQKLRGREDVFSELTLLVEGLGVGNQTQVEEYLIGPQYNNDDDEIHSDDKDRVRLYGPEDGVSWVAKPVKGGQSALNLGSRHGSIAAQSNAFVDPLVTLFGSVHENLPSTIGSMHNIIFPNMGSMLSIVGNNQVASVDNNWDEENQEHEHPTTTDSPDNLRSPLLSQRGSHMAPRSSSMFNSGGDETAIGIGGGWQLAYKVSEKVDKDGRKEEIVERMYLHQEGGIGSRRGSIVAGADNDVNPEEGEFVQAAALVSQSICPRQVIDGTASAVRPAQLVPKGPSFGDLCEPGVRRALIVGVGLQMLQQAAGVNGVLYYTPQILNQAGVGVLLANLGLSSDSASIFISLLTAFAMLPCIVFAMKLIDVSGRRSLLLCTIPILILALLAIILTRVVHMGSVLQAIISAVGVTTYVSCFVMGFGAIPNILCSEIFPTRVRGLCITICALAYWVCNIIVTYSLPAMLSSIGLSGVFTLYSIGCIIAWIFIFLKVPETKGMPLEVISELFTVSATTLAKTD